MSALFNESRYVQTLLMRNKLRSLPRFAILPFLRGKFPTAYTVLLYLLNRADSASCSQRYFSVCIPYQFMSITLTWYNNHQSLKNLPSASQNTPSLSSIITSIDVLSIVMGGNVMPMDTVNSWSPSRALSSMINTIAQDSITPGINVICNGSSAEKSCPLTGKKMEEREIRFQQLKCHINEAHLFKKIIRNNAWENKDIAYVIISVFVHLMAHQCNWALHQLNSDVTPNSFPSVPCLVSISKIVGIGYSVRG